MESPAPAPSRGLTVNDLVRAYLARHPCPPGARGRTLRRLAQCRTEALGGRVLGCDACGYSQFAWNGCLDRNCPSCSGLTSARWVAAQLAHLLPVPYFHVVFTLPRPVADLALRNKTTLYGLLMRTSADVVQTIARDPKHLGAEVGIQSVLHTWSQRLEHHPHVHMVIPGGGIDREGRWKACREGFFLPTLVLGALFRRHFLEALDALRAEGKLRFDGALESLKGDEPWRAWLEAARRVRWNVYAKRPFAGPEAVLKYLAGYTHRGPISNARLLAFDGARVTFRARGRSGALPERLQMPLETFVRRFLFHVAPKGFIRLRSYGFLAHRVRKSTIPSLREQLGTVVPSSTPLRPSPHDVCPRCAQGRLVSRLDVTSEALGGVVLFEPANATTGPPQFHSGPWRAA